MSNPIEDVEINWPPNKSYVAGVVFKHVTYAGKGWNVETVYFGREGSTNPRMRIGRIDEHGNYEWELVFYNDTRAI